MGKKAMIQNKSYYQLKREGAGLTREKASERMNMSHSRLERIEKHPEQLVPEDLLQMERLYQDRSICNHYCANDCAIGKKYVPELEVKAISKMSIELINSLNRMGRERERFLEIVEDETITSDEAEDYQRIRQLLQQVRISAESLLIWMDEHHIPKDQGNLAGSRQEQGENRTQTSVQNGCVS